MEDQVLGALADYTDEWDANYFKPLTDELERVLTDRTAKTGPSPSDIPHLWHALSVHINPAGRLLPAYGPALMELANAILLQWRVSDSDLVRLNMMRPNDPDGAAWLVILMVLDSTGPIPLVNEDPRYGDRTIAYDYCRRVVAQTLRVARRVLRGQPYGVGLIFTVIQSMQRNARDLRKPLGDRLYEQWRRAEKEGGLVLDVWDLHLAIVEVSPPSPRDVTTIYTRTLEALVNALTRTWQLRAADEPRVLALAKAEDRRRKDLLRELARAGLLSALADRAVPRKIRKGNTYLEGGLPLRPTDDVPMREFLRWLKSDAIRRAEGELRASDPLLGTGEPAILSHPDLAVGLDDPRVDAIYTAARDDTDRQLVDLLAKGHSIAEAAQEMGKNYEMVKKRTQRLRDRARSAMG